MKFAIIGDIHYAKSGGLLNGKQQKLIEFSEELLTNFINETNKIDDLSFIINLGDSIEDIGDEAIDKQYFSKVQEIFKKSKHKVFHTIGNHDQKTISENTLKDLLGYKELYYTFEIEEFKFIVLFSKVLGDHKNNPEDILAVIDEDQLTWLRKELNTNKKTVIFSHYSVAKVNTQNNQWFSKNPQMAYVKNCKEIGEILENSGNVIAYINGHIHSNNVFNQNNITYITQQSLIENFCGKDVPAGTYSIVDLSNERLEMTMFGNDKLNITIRI